MSDLTGSELFASGSVAFLFGAAHNTTILDVLGDGHSRTTEVEQHRSTGHSTLTRVFITNTNNAGQATYCAVLSSGYTGRSHSRRPFVLGPGGGQTATLLMIVTCLFVNDCRLMADAGRRYKKGQRCSRCLGPQHVFRMFVTFRRVHLRTVNASY